MSWGAHEYFMHPIFVLKNGCDSQSKNLAGMSGRKKLRDKSYL
jgi:hypothetical protein